MASVPVPVPWTLIKLHDFCKDEEILIQFLFQKHLLKSDHRCPTCHDVMKLSGDRFICRKTSTIPKKGKSKCNSQVSIRKHSWFSQSKLGFGTILKALCYSRIKN